MAKYSYEFKKEVVNAYLRGEGGRKYLAKKYGVPSSQMIVQWVKNYNANGDEGLKISRENKNYPFDFKLRVVELYLSSEVSYQKLASSQGINNPAILFRWVNEFRIVGPDALRPKKKGRKKSLEANKVNNKLQLKQDIEQVDKSSERVKQLEDELLKLRIENAFLKELRRLRLEDEAKTRDLHESLTASEDSSN